MPKRETTAAELAEILDIDAKTARRWAAGGCPHTRKDGRFLFDAAEVVGWLKANHRTAKPGRPEHPDSPALRAAKLRKEMALAAKYELQVERERTETVSLIDAKRFAMSQLADTHGQFDGLGAAIAPALEGLGAAERQDIIDRAVNERLLRLAGGR